MEFLAIKDAGLIPFVLSQILDTCVTGITLSDPDQEDNPIIYANEMFELITGELNAVFHLRTQHWAYPCYRGKVDCQKISARPLLLASPSLYPRACLHRKKRTSLVSINGSTNTTFCVKGEQWVPTRCRYSTMMKAPCFGRYSSVP